MIEDVDQLDLATWPLILRPADVYIDRLNQAPYCPKCGKRTTWKACKEHGMCPKCLRVWTFRAVTPDDVLPHHANKIRWLNHQGRQNAREKTTVSASLEIITRELNKDPGKGGVDCRIAGKVWTIHAVAYVLANRGFLPGEYLPRSTKAPWVHPSDVGVISYRCSHVDEDSRRIEHERCRCFNGLSPCGCYCHQGGTA